MIRNLLTALLVGIVGLAPLQTNAEAPKHPLKPLLWKVEGQGLEKPSWLFGTIHLGRKPLDVLHPKVEKALGDSDTIYTEIPMDTETQMAAAMQMIRKDGKTLGQSIGDKLVKELNAELKHINPQLSAQQLGMLKTWAVAATVPMLKEQMAGKTAVDNIVWNKGKAAKKELKSLETAEMQVGVFNKFTEEEQIAYLSETLKLQREYRQKNEDPVQEMIAAYVSGEPDQLNAVINKAVQTMLEGEQKELGMKFKKLLFDDRDTSMTATIAEHLKAEPGKTHFFAVGAAHYIGETSICEQLRQKGYTVTLFQD